MSQKLRINKQGTHCLTAMSLSNMEDDNTYNARNCRVFIIEHWAECWREQ